MRKNVLLLSIAVLVLFIVSATAQKAFCAVRISPTVIELDSTDSRNNFITTSFEVSAAKNEKIRFKIYPEFFNISEQGSLTVNPDKNAPNSLVNKVRFVPNEFTLENGRAQKIRLTFVDINKLPDGESRLVLFLEDAVQRSLNLPSPQSGINTRVMVKTRVGVPVYLDKGRVSKIGALQDLNVTNVGDELNYSFALNSTGNSKIRYKANAQLIKNKELVDQFELKSSAVQAGTVQKQKGIIPVAKLLPNETYRLKTIVEYKDASGKSKSLISEKEFKTGANLPVPQVVESVPQGEDVILDET